MSLGGKIAGSLPSNARIRLLSGIFRCPTVFDKLTDGRLCDDVIRYKVSSSRNQTAKGLGGRFSQLEKNRRTPANNKSPMTDLRQSFGV